MNSNHIKIIFIVVIIVIGISIFLHPSSIAKEIEKDSKFNYSTSITGTYSRSGKANVYITDMSVTDAALYIMSKRKPQSHTDLENKESIQLVYDDYYILIYKSEDLKTYVQISSRKYIHQNGYHSLYRPYRRNIITFYDASYISGAYYRSDSKRYSGGYYKTKTGSSSSSGSVRSGSTNSRTSVGGGISFGK